MEKMEKSRCCDLDTWGREREANFDLKIVASSGPFKEKEKPDRRCTRTKKRKKNVCFLRERKAGEKKIGVHGKNNDDPPHPPSQDVGGEKDVAAWSGGSPRNRGKKKEALADSSSP